MEKQFEINSKHVVSDAEENCRKSRNFTKNRDDCNVQMHAFSTTDMQ
jgi:hypothetical protein